MSADTFRVLFRKYWIVLIPLIWVLAWTSRDWLMGSAAQQDAAAPPEVLTTAAVPPSMTPMVASPTNAVPAVPYPLPMPVAAIAPDPEVSSASGQTPEPPSVTIPQAVAAPAPVDPLATSPLSETDVVSPLPLPDVLADELPDVLADVTPDVLPDALADETTESIPLADTASPAPAAATATSAPVAAPPSASSQTADSTAATAAAHTASAAEVAPTSVATATATVPNRDVATVSASTTPTSASSLQMQAQWMLRTRGPQAAATFLESRLGTVSPDLPGLADLYGELGNLYFSAGNAASGLRAFDAALGLLAEEERARMIRRMEPWYERHHPEGRAHLEQFR